MSLNWNWSEKCGELIFEERGKEFKYNLYKGNAYLIFVAEFEEDGVERYTVASFWVDKAHAKRCLGLEKGTDNIYDNGWQKVKKFRINKKKHSKAAEIVGLLAKAFDEIDIEVYSEE